MAFWIFILISTLIMPVLMIVFGNIFIKKVPNNINRVYGYRTKNSMKSMESWKFAHNYIGKLWKNFGIISLPITIIIMMFSINGSENKIGFFGIGIITIQMLTLFLSIFLTERKLKIKFN